MKKSHRHLSDLELLMFVDHELPEAEYHLLWDHLKECHKCRAKRLALEMELEDLIPPRLTNYPHSKDHLESRASLIRKMEEVSAEEDCEAVTSPTMELLT